MAATVLHSIALWDGIACSGASLPILSGVPFPTFSWLGFNDRASSANGVIGSATLWERSWFGAVPLSSAASAASASRSRT